MSEGELNPKSSEEEEEAEGENKSEDESSDAEKPEEESSDYDSDSEYESIPEGEPPVGPIGNFVDDYADIPEEDDSPEANVKRFLRVLNSRSLQLKREEEDEDYEYHEDLFDFPKDPENWREEDLKELWADAPIGMTKPGWDPNWVDEEELEVIREEIEDGKDPPIAPFYVPYRKPYPVIPDNHYDISNPKSVIEELDRIEEFLIWVSYIFEDGSTYEGTVWDDLAHGKGVYVAEEGLVRYEGEWLQNDMEGHGVVEVDIPDIEPVPGSKLEAKMRAEGRPIYRDSLSPEDRKWFEMDVEDTMRLHDGNWEIPFYEREEWVQYLGSKPEKGRYRYAGEWKHGRMHGCGVWEINEQPLFGRFYFGQLLEEADGCDEDISTMHAGIAEVAAAKARMFVNKPDGMVREQWGPYTDPQHPYFYEEDEVWQAPGFINQFYEVPDHWKVYIEEVDKEREMWLNSFYKAPLRLPMPAELEYWWANEEKPEFVLINQEPKPDPKDPTNMVYTDDPLILHTPTGRLIDYVEDEEHGIRLFWVPFINEDGSYEEQPNDGFLPLGFDEFYGRKEIVKEENMLSRLLTRLDNAIKPTIEKFDKWVEEKKKEAELELELIEKEYECEQAELELEELIEDMDDELEMVQKEEERKLIEDNKEGDVNSGGVTSQDDNNQVPVDLVEEAADAEEEDEDEEEDVAEPSSFGSIADENKIEDLGQKGNKGPKSPFSSSSLSFASSSLASPFCLVSAVPSQLQKTFLAWKNRKVIESPPPAAAAAVDFSSPSYSCASFPNKGKQNWSLKARKQTEIQALHMRKKQQPHLPRGLTCNSSSMQRQSVFEKESCSHAAYPRTSLQNILSLHSSFDVGIQ